MSVFVLLIFFVWLVTTMEDSERETREHLERMDDFFDRLTVWIEEHK